MSKKVVKKTRIKLFNLVLILLVLVGLFFFGKYIIEQPVKNIVVKAEFQLRGLGRELILFLEHKFSGAFKRMTVGTGDSPLTVPFYEKCGFRKYRVIRNFFTDNYDHPIYEAGVRLCDMICFEKELTEDHGTDR